MKRVILGSLAIAWIGVTMVITDGCTINPFLPPDFDEYHKNDVGGSGGDKSTSSNPTGMGGTGGVAETGGVAGTGGTAGTGGSGGSGGMVDADAGPPCFCKDDNNDCTIETVGADCPNGDEAACHVITPNVDCGPATQWCSDKGVCRDCQTCTTGECTARCDGVKCGVDSVCKSGLCVLGDENLCCDTRCANDCDACNRFGAEGTCVPLPKGATSLTCTAGRVCNGMGMCVTDAKAVLGAPCVPLMAFNCASGVCRGEYCRSDVNQPCIDDVECGTNLCVGATLQTRKCKSCVVNSGQCHEGSVCETATGNCKAALGQPATVATECADSRATLSGFMCVLPPGATCNAHAECASRNCENGVCSALCSTSGQCLANTTCNSSTGTCGLPSGSYCVQGNVCASGKCTGFPRRCE